MIHDRYTIFLKDLDEAMTDMGVCVWRTPVRAPKANLVCEHFDATYAQMPGLSETRQRTPSEDGHREIRNPLQSRHASLLSRPWISELTQDRVPDSGHRHKLRRLPCRKEFGVRLVYIINTDW